MNEEIIEINVLSTELKKQNSTSRWFQIKEMLKTELRLTGKTDLLQKLDKLWGLTKHAIPYPPPCICGSRTYSYTYRKADTERYWEIFARCVNPNCRYMRRYLPSAKYSWSRPESALKELKEIPTFYQMDGQKVEEP